MPIREQLQKLMLKNGMTVRELSEKSGVPKPTIYALLKRDSTSVTSATAAKLARGLDCSPAEIYGFDSEIKKRYDELYSRYIDTLLKIEEGNNNSLNCVEITNEDGEIIKRQIHTNPELREILDYLDMGLNVIEEQNGITDDSPNNLAPIISYYRELNDEGRLKLIERAEELVQLPKYKK